MSALVIVVRSRLNNGVIIAKLVRGTKIESKTSYSFSKPKPRLKKQPTISKSMVVPVEGIEPPLLAEHDFESCASTNSATRAPALMELWI